ncbi:sensor histidine kinase [Pararhodobacter sp.]|uniref:sensor histidine kinase n=1 Tax=Pararhodobacter sp. TaxID=2127056 RepID=UPI002FDDF59A
MKRSRLPFLPKLTERLAVRLVLLLTLALLPLGVVAVMTTAQTVADARVSAERAMVGVTAEAVAGKRALIESAFASASTLGPLALERLANPEECTVILSDFVRRSGVFSFVSLIETDGQMRCRSDGQSSSIAGTPQFESLMERPAASVTAQARDLARNEAVMIVTQPIREGVTLRGFIMITVPQRSVELMRRLPVNSGPASTVLFNTDGELITGMDDPETMARLPANRPLAEFPDNPDERIFYGQTVGGESASFAVAELIPRRLYAVGTWTGSMDAQTGMRAAVMPLILPVLMWVASLGVAYFAVYRLVLRHIRTLNRQMRRFALGYRDAPPDIIEDAPSELREVSATFQKLARILARDEAELEASLAEKTVLLKEIHHRVKNNLQLIASILNLQMRQVRDPSARRVLQSVQDRVIGLATIHRSLYQSERLSELRADQLMDEITRQLLALGAAPGSGISVHTRFEPLMLAPDRLVPLSLLLSEGVTNALKYIGSPEDGGAPWLEITLTLNDDEVTLNVTNSLSAAAVEPDPDAPDFDSTRLGADLIEAFAMQLEGVLEQGEIDTAKGPAWQLSLSFACETSDDLAQGLLSDPEPEAREAE